MDWVWALLGVVVGATLALTSFYIEGKKKMREIEIEAYTDEHREDIIKSFEAWEKVERKMLEKQKKRYGRVLKKIKGKNGINWQMLEYIMRECGFKFCMRSNSFECDGGKK